MTREQRRLGLTAAAIAVVIVAIPVVVIFASQSSKTSGTSKGRPDQTASTDRGIESRPAVAKAANVEWNREEFLNHFRANGFPGWHATSHSGYWIFSDEMLEPDYARVRILVMWQFIAKMDTFYMREYSSPQNAHFAVGEFGSKESFSWGPYVVYCNPGLQNKIKAALGVSVPRSKS